MNILYLILFLIGGSFLVFFIIDKVVMGKERVFKKPRHKKNREPFPTDRVSTPYNTFGKEKEAPFVEKEKIEPPIETAEEKMNAPVERDSEKERIMKSLEQDLCSHKEINKEELKKDGIRFFDE
ncbi:MAG TPA: hypothetical protein PK466_12090 [Thermotogota bacterium]|nr:hypothetical protein [Thermotogota bacterium]HPJ90267.1 hypothetical protein [Thermotogota bacterium]HPR97065.1 hypothetical protein [Thermotogota bacterium]